MKNEFYQGYDGTDLGKKEVGRMATEDIGMNRAFVEVSGPAFGALRKSIGVDGIKAKAKTREEAAKLTGDEIHPPEAGLSSDTDVGKIMYDGFPELREFMYAREIGGKLKIKIMVGTSGNKIEK